MVKYVLTTEDGDIWEYDDLEDAKCDKYIFGGTIEVVETE